MKYEIQNTPQLRFQEFDGEWEKSKLNKFASLNPKNSELPESFIYIDLESVTDGLLIKESVISKNEAPSRAQRILKDKDILYQTVRPYQKNNLYFDKVGDYVASTGYAQIRTKNDSQFLFQFLHTEKFVANVMLRCTGTSYPAINSSDLSSIEISYPQLPEQQKIASFLSAVDEKTQQLSRKKELLEQYKKGVMQQLFSGKLRFKDENGKDYADWEEKKLGDVGSIVSGLTYSPDDINEDGILVLRSSNVQNRRLSFQDNVYVKTSAFNPVKLNDILICVRNGSKHLIGKNTIIDKETAGVAFGAFMSVYRSNYNLYIFHYFDTDEYKNEVHKNLGATINSINGSDLKKFKIPFPSIEEQQKIANFLSSIDTKIESTSQQINQMQSFKKGLLQQMFV